MQGFEKFRAYMNGFCSHYVVIGGVATVLTQEERGLPVRDSKDVDMIIICQPESKFYMKHVVKRVVVLQPISILQRC